MMRGPLNIESSTPACCLELAALRLQGLTDLRGHLPIEPGAVGDDDEGRMHLHFSPGRWLTVCPSAAAAKQGLPASLSVVDVTGKWHLLRLTGTGAENVLRFQLPVDGIFTGRACAAITIFDCPVVIQRCGAGFDVWTHASYSEHLRDALANAHRNLQSTSPTEAT